VVSHVSGWSWEPDATDPDELENPTVGRCTLTASKPVLKAKRLWFQRLKIEYHKLLSTFAFNFNLRRYATGCYRRTFEVPDGWTANGRRVFALFEAGCCNFKLVETRVIMKAPGFISARSYNTMPCCQVLLSMQLAPIHGGRGLGVLLLGQR